MVDRNSRAGFGFQSISPAHTKALCNDMDFASPIPQHFEYDRVLRLRAGIPKDLYPSRRQNMLTSIKHALKQMKSLVENICYKGVGEFLTSES